MTKRVNLSRESADGFAAWMKTCGAFEMPIRSTDEVYRMMIAKRHGKLAVIYRNRAGLLVSGASSALYRAYLAGHADIDLTPERIKISAPAKMVYRLFDRDGPHCFYCGSTFEGPEDPNLTIEEIFAVSKGGFRCDDNCALACRTCNVKVGNLPVVEKIKMRDAMRAKWQRT